MYEGVVAVNELAGGVGDVHTLLHLLKQQAIFFFCGTAVRNVADYVNGAFLRAALLGVGRSRNHRIAAETGVSAFGELFVASHGAVWTTGPLAKGVGQG